MKNIQNYKTYEKKHLKEVEKEEPTPEVEEVKKPYEKCDNKVSEIKTDEHLIVRFEEFKI